ncbi:hypothetical protein [Acinetobacter rudis]|uniref:Uncharacterized protein n=1 Tax=Acinetobacter rudis TaxID=632955 RepID=A0AAW8JD75_9GAMM|nr:hypothetical protein [Acinetobacter rudis]MDQ8937035.1 hypothetical protein [Acinetobacter rudis]MDQ9019240.1 hypothetical protein [Acinetobacter rudis]
MKANEFKVGDFVVKSKYDQGPLEVVEIQGDLLILGKHSRVAVLKTNARHATLEEIEAIRRLIPSNTMELEELNMVDVPPTAIVVDL